MKEHCIINCIKSTTTSSEELKVSNTACGALIKINISFLFVTFKESCVGMGKKYWLDTFQILKNARSDTHHASFKIIVSQSH